jgi:large conductance mechanosensitive channel
MIVKQVNRLLPPPPPPPPAEVKDCPQCFTKIPLQAKRCPACTSTL